jgi:probable addiction module antidote protein
MVLERIQEAAMRKSKLYQPDLIENLRDAREAEEYLNTALEEDDPELFLLALRNVAEAQGGVAQLADKAKLNRESLYRMLSERGNPELRSLEALLHALGFRLAVTANVRQ